MHVLSAGATTDAASWTGLQLDGQRLLVFAGINHRTRYNDLWVLDVPSQQWTQLEIAGEAPTPRAHHTAIKFQNCIYVFGGYAALHKL